MYNCPNCGGGFRFDIKSQALLCDHCQTSMNPYDYEKEHDAEQTTEYEVTRFACPQCGAEIVGTENAAAAFCSFCGGSTILDAHITKEKRPTHIIPFKQTKEDCKKAYESLMKRAFFAPKELKNPKYIDNFRGIYMPYWLYNISQNGSVHMPAEESHRSGDYIITKHYSCNADVVGTYKDISFDAASNFADDISEGIATYDTSQMQDFTPSMLCGFYADVADVPEHLYREDAKEIANAHTANKLVSHPSFKRYGPKKPSNADIARSLNTDVAEVDSAMFPVWFLSYQKNGRVAYATVNGQNGRMSVDVPIDIKKFLITTGVLAIVLFIIMNMMFTFVPKTPLIISIIIGLISIGINCAEIKRIKGKESHTDDKGYKTSHSEKIKEAAPVKTKPGYLASLVAVIIAVIVLFLAPVHDYYYYGAAVLCGIGILLTLLDVLQKYNLLSTSKLPQFNRTGGDDDAY